MASIPARAESAGSNKQESVRHGVFWLTELVIAILLAILTVIVKRHPGPLPGDVSVERADQAVLLGKGLITSGIEAVSTLNWPIPAAVSIAVLVVIFLLLRRWLDAILVVLCSAVDDGTSAILNRWVHRPRPAGHGIHVLTKISGSYGYPSGHVAHVTAVFGFLFFLTYQVKHPRWRLLVAVLRILAVVIIVLMPFSRITEGEHWPSDTLAGFLYGLFFAVLFAYIWTWAAHRWPRLTARDER